jgi:hypothetical protein
MLLFKGPDHYRQQLAEGFIFRTQAITFSPFVDLRQETNEALIISTALCRSPGE